MRRNDINLLPRKKQISFADVFMVISILLALALIVTGGIIVPEYLLQSKREELKLVEEGLSEFENIEIDYYQKMQEFTQLKNHKENLDTFRETERQVLELMNFVIGSKPSTITLTSQNYENEQIVLIGNSDNVKDIAGFEVSLRRLGIFRDIHLESVNTTDEKLDFHMTLFHPIKTEKAGGTE